MLQKGFSIVLCTYNGTTRLEPTLTHLSELEIPKGNAVELVVIDNASTDCTETFVKSTWVKLGEPFPLKFMKEKRPGKGYAIEMGYDNAAYDLIVTVDDDNWLRSDYLLHTYQQYLENSALVLLGGRSTAEFEGKVPSWVQDVLNHNAIGIQQEFSGRIPASNKFLWGAGMVVKNSFWKGLRNAGFSFITSKQSGKALGEDTELSVAAIIAGNERYYCDKMVFKHFMPKDRFNWENSINQFKGFGSTHVVFDAYFYIYDCIKQNKKPSTLFWLKQFANRLKELKSFTIIQWIFYFFIKPKGEYYFLRQNMFISELKHTFTFRKIQNSVFQTLYNWQVNYLK